MSEYAWILFLSLALPLLLSFYRPLKFYRNPKGLIFSILWVLVLFGGWDVWATYRGHWSFDPDSVWGPEIINLPLEEVAFFIVIPFCCVFSWEVVLFFKNKIK